MKYARAKQNKKNKTISIVTILAGLLVISAITAFTLRRNGDNLNVLDGSGLGNAEETYTYILDEEIVTQKLIGEEFTFEPNNDTSGKLAYKFNSITAYDNMYDLAGLELKENLDKS